MRRTAEDQDQDQDRSFDLTIKQQRRADTLKNVLKFKTTIFGKYCLQ